MTIIEKIEDIKGHLSYGCVYDKVLMTTEFYQELKASMPVAAEADKLKVTLFGVRVEIDDSMTNWSDIDTSRGYKFIIR